MHSKDVFDYTHAVSLLRDIVCNEVGPKMLAYRAKEPVKVSTKKTYADVVTFADQFSEATIYDHLHRHYPDHTIFGEEGTKEENKDSTFEWFIDPVDGTIPYASGGENFSICVGLLAHGIPTMGIIFYPAKNKLLHAIKGKGAYLNDTILTNTKELIDLSNAVVALAAPAGPSSGDYIDEYIKPIYARIRSGVFSGSYSADVLQLMEGSVDSVVLANATPYDVAATIAIAREAGYEAEGIDGKEIDFHKEKVPVLYSATKELQHEILVLLRSSKSNKKV